MLFRFACLASLLIVLINIVRSDKRIKLCDGGTGNGVYTIGVPPEHSNITFRFVLKKIRSSRRRNDVVLYYSLEEECIFYLRFNKVSIKWNVWKEDNDTMDLTRYVSNNTLNHFPVLKYCNLWPEENGISSSVKGMRTFEFSFLPSFVEGDFHTLCNSFFSFDSDFFVVYRGTGEEVIDESDKAKAWDGEKKQDDDVALERKDEADDWTLVVSILCLMVVVIVGLALFAVFLMRRWNRQY